MNPSRLITNRCPSGASRIRCVAHSWPNGHELIPFVAKQPVSSSYPQHATSTEAKAIKMARIAGAGMVGGQSAKCELIETGRRYAYQSFKCPNPEISVRGYGQCLGPWVVEKVEIFSVEPNQAEAIDDQPKKTILSLFGLIYYRAGQTLLVGEMSTEDAARRLVWIKRARRDT